MPRNATDTTSKGNTNMDNEARQAAQRILAKRGELKLSYDSYEDGCGPMGRPLLCSEMVVVRSMVELDAAIERVLADNPRANYWTDDGDLTDAGIFNSWLHR